MAKMVEITCKCGCKRKKMVREADRKRGWGLFYSKSCKAKYQTRKLGYHYSRYYDEDERDLFHPFDSGYFGHGQE